MPYPANMAVHGPTRSLEAYLTELTDRHDRLSAALRAGERIANSQTRDELRELHRRIREVEAEIDARGV